MALSLEPPEKVRKLRTALHAKAKAAPTYRFDLLYDKLYRADVLAYAYRVCKAHRGAPGVDRQTFADIEAYGEERWLCEAIREETGPRWLWTTAEDRVAKLNPLLIGWAHYFCVGPVGSAYRAIDRYVRFRLRQWLRRKHQQPSRAITRWPDTYLNETLGLVRLVSLARRLPWAKA